MNSPRACQQVSTMIDISPATFALFPPPLFSLCVCFVEYFQENPNHFQANPKILVSNKKGR